MLKAVSDSYLDNADADINKFLSAKMEQLDISVSPDFYEHISEEIKEQTDKLKDTRDCPYINLVHSQKIKQACLTLQKFNFSAPYESWEQNEREKKGFCYLIVRPEHRWKEIAGNVLALVKKRETTHPKAPLDSVWPFDAQYEKFLWLYLQKGFNSKKKNIEVKEKRGESLLTLTVKKDTAEFLEVDRALSSLNFLYCEDKPLIPDLKDRT